MDGGGGNLSWEGRLSVGCYRISGFFIVLMLSLRTNKKKYVNPTFSPLYPLFSRGSRKVLPALISRQLKKNLLKTSISNKLTLKSTGSCMI